MRDYDGSDVGEPESSAGFAAAPDAFARMWTPHRIAYVERGGGSGEDACAFCAAPAKSDEDGLIVHRGRLAYVLLNLFPYNSGHALVVPYRHVAMYDEATDAETAEIATLTQETMRVLAATARVGGYNIGMNQGEVAGAGIAAHLHQHVVPRWANDANFMPIVAQVKTVPRLLGEVREQLAKAWPS